MKTKLLLPLALLAAAAPLQAITLTIESTIESWSLFDPDYPPPYGPYNWLTGYEDVAVGDPFAIRFTFDETAPLVPSPTNPAVFNGIIQSFEFMLEGEPKLTFTNLNLTLRNGYQDVDTFEITSPLVSVPTVVGLKDWGPRGVAFLKLTDAGNQALVTGAAIDFARFFDSPDDHFSSLVSFQTGSPYGGYGPSLGAGSSGPASLGAPPAPPVSSVPDAGATALLSAVGLGSLLMGRLRRRRREAQDAVSNLSA